MGDFNIHLDEQDATAAAFSELLTTFDLKQHISSPTHDRGHMLDVFITWLDYLLLESAKTIETYLSDHLAVIVDLTLTRTLPPLFSYITARPWHKLDLACFKMN